MVVDGKVTLSISSKDENNQIKLKTLKAKEISETRDRFDRFGTSKNKSLFGKNLKKNLFKKHFYCRGTISFIQIQNLSHFKKSNLVR